MASPELPHCDTPAAVLAFAQRRRAAAQRAEIDVLEAALVWASMHPEESVSTGSTNGVSTGSTNGASGLVFGELAVPLAGEGAPLVAEFAPMEFGAALGMSTDSARWAAARRRCANASTAAGVSQWGSSGEAMPHSTRTHVRCESG